MSNRDKHARYRDNQSLPERKNFWYAFARDQRSTLKTE